MKKLALALATSVLAPLAACDEVPDASGPHGLGDDGGAEEGGTTGDEEDDEGESSGGTTGEIDDSEAPSRFSVRPRVKVVSFDPLVGGVRLHQHYAAKGWKDPEGMARSYRDAVRDATSGSVEYQIESFTVTEGFPQRVDGMQYTADTYTACIDSQMGCLPDSPYESDIAHYATEGDWCAEAATGIDEIWVFGAPNFGMPESQMMGRGAHWLNSTPLQVDCETPLVIMYFSYQRGVAEMLHNLGHRIESHLGHIFSAWPGGMERSPWVEFSRKASTGESECGNVHFPPNAFSDYDYARAEPVASGCSRWNNYPDHEFPSFNTVSCETWGCTGDAQYGYMSWWIARLPNREGFDANGFQTDWRRFIFDYRSYL